MNPLSNLYDEFFGKKVQKMLDRSKPLATMGFLGQRYSEARQAKNRLMKSLHLTTGKQYRKYLKGVRRDNKLNA